MRKISSLSLLLPCLSLLLCGCGEATAPIQKADLPAGGTEAPVRMEPFVIKEAAPTADDQVKSAVDGTSALPLVIYFGDENCETILSERILVQEETLEPQVIADALYQKGVFNTPIEVTGFQCVQNRIELDLSEDFAVMIRNMGTSGEYIMLGSLVNSFLTAYGSDSLLLTIEGDVLETGHNIYDYPLKYYS